MTGSEDATAEAALGRVVHRAMGERAVDGGGRVVGTGFPSLDQLLGGGFRSGDLIVLTGEAASGKSALALAMGLRASASGRVVAHLTGEHSIERVIERALAIEGRAPIDALQHGSLDASEREAVAQAALGLRASLPLLEPLGWGMSAVADTLRRALDLDLAVVDPLEALATAAGTLDEELALAVRQLKELALELQAAILVTAAPRAALRGRADPRPTLDDLPALGALKTHADVVLGLFREEMYQHDRGIEGATELRILKNRNGPEGYVDLFFYKKWLRFEDMVEPDR